jgi:hypothetical protein
MMLSTHKVRSQKDKNIIYDVIVFDTFNTCSCPYYQYYQNCKHIKFILKKYYKPNS